MDGSEREKKKTAAFLGLFRARVLLHLAQQYALSPMAHG
jgi:hypothetical protein